MKSIVFVLESLFFAFFLAYSLPASALTDREEMTGEHLFLQAAGATTSPFEPEKPSDKVFVVNSGSGLDTGCTFNDQSPLQIHLPMRRVIGDIQKLKSSGVLNANAILKLPVYDIDIPDEIDKISFNGHKLTPDALTGSNGVWQLNLFKIPVEWINFPKDPGVNQTVQSEDNIITIDIDTANPGNPTWCMSVDWVELSLDMSAVPVVFIHGLDLVGNCKDDCGNTWAGSQVVEQVKTLGLPNSGSEVSLGGRGDFASRLPKLTSFINTYKNRWGVNQLTLVGHSRGGLDTRNYINSPEGAKSVLQHVQFGTPNAGTPIASANGIIGGESQRELSEPRMAAFNANHPFPPTVGLSSIPGHAQTVQDANRSDCGAFLDEMNGKNRASDGTVPVSSVHALPVGVDVPAVVSVTPGDRTACHTHVHRDASAGITSGVATIKHPTGVVAVQESSRVIQNATIKAAVGTLNSSFSYPLSFNFSEQAATVNNGSTGDISFSLPGAVPITVRLVSEAATFTATFTTPSGTVLQPGAGVEINSGTGLFGPETLLSLDAAHAVAGTWKVTYAVTDLDASVTQSSIVLTVATDSDHSLAGTFSQSPEFLKATQNGTVAVSLLNGSAPVQGATVVLTLPSGNIALVESITTPGTYEGYITVATAGTTSGGLTVTFAGITSYAGIVFNILPATTDLGSDITDQGISNSANGLYDLLDINVPVTVDSTKHYRLNGTLRTPSGKIITTEAEADLNAGASSIHLQFDGNSIYNTGDNGPYSIENIKLFTFPDGLSSELIDVLDLSYQTSAYSVSSFQHKAVSIDATQDVTSNTSDTNQDGKLDHLQVAIPIYSTEAVASFYNWSASLYDSNGFLLSIASNSGTVATGKSTITLDFNVSTIGPNAIDGPFLLGGFLLYGQSSLSQNAVAQITTPSIDQFVGFTPCSLTTTNVQFPDTKLPNTPAAQALSVTNSGTARCVLTGIDVSSNDFTVVPASSFPIIMEAGATTSFSVALVKPTVGSHSAIITLAASGNQSAVATSTVTGIVNPSPVNQPPVANAGTKQTVTSGTLVTLNGSGSSDPDNGPSPLIYAWSQVGGPAVTLSGATTASPTFTPAQANDYVFGLVVNDGQASSPQSTVTVHVTANTPFNQPPVANAGTNQTVTSGTLVTLNGFGSSDPDNGPSPFIYAWRQVSGPTVALSGATTASPTFTPVQTGEYVFGLAVNDGQASSPQSTVTVHVTSNTQPVTECLFNWAEGNYPTLFSPAGATTTVGGIYTYRYYSATNAYVGVSSIDGHVYYLGPNGMMQDEGQLSYWSPQAGCQVPPPLPTDCLFNWAEVNYPTLFAPAGATTTVGGIYTYRYYSATNAYVGVSSVDGHVYYLGSDGVMQDEGTLYYWLPLAGCQGF